MILLNLTPYPLRTARNRFALEGPLGCRYISVDPKETALEFYEKIGFRYWTKSKRRMYLNMMDVAQQLEPDESLDPWSEDLSQ